MAKNYLFLSLCCCVAFIFGAKAQKVIYVNAVNSSSTQNGLSWANAFKDFQAGVNAASPGDNVFVAKGTYQPASGQSFFMKEGVKIYGGFAGTENNLSQRNLAVGNNSILKGNGNRVIDNSSNHLTVAAILDGFIITGGNTSIVGGGMYNVDSSPTIFNCIFSENSAGQGGGMCNAVSFPTIVNSIFWSNTATDGGAGMYNTGSKPTVINCTFSKNSTSASGGGIFHVPNYPLTIINSIFWNNTALVEGVDIYQVFPGIPTINYSYMQTDFTDNSTGNITGSSDPFVNSSNPAGADGIFGTADDGLVLKAGSAAVNAGDPQTNIVGYVVQAGNTDITGAARIQNGIIDIGAYEHKPPVKWYVKPGASGTGESWGDAGDFQTIISNASGGDSIFVAQGTYQPASGQSFSMKEGVKIYGGFDGTETSIGQRDLATGNSSILKGNGNRVIDNSSNNLTTTAVLDGFTITGGSIPNGDSNGGGMLNTHSSPTISNCIFSGNSATLNGGGMGNNQSSPVIVNCSFIGNTATYNGGALYNSFSSPDIINSIFSGNVAPGGSGIYNNDASPAVITNCTFFDNTSEGVFNENSDPVITNCIIYGNGAGIFRLGTSNPTVTYSLVQGITGGTGGNIDGNADPLFVDAANGNFQLQQASPAINAGNNAALPAGETTDIAGNLRIVHGIVDMGAYEYQGAVLPITLEIFTAIKDGNEAKLSWTTASESNNREFLIFRSSDGNTFSEIGKVTGAGTTFLPKDYTFYDRDPANGINYYRLQQIDFDGRTTEAGIRTVRFSFENNRVKMYPNPTENHIKIEFDAGLYHQLELTDYTGRVLQKVTLGIDDREKALQLNNYPAGAYLIKLIGEQVVIEKVIKK